VLQKRPHDPPGSDEEEKHQEDSYNWGVRQIEDSIKLTLDETAILVEKLPNNKQFMLRINSFREQLRGASAHLSPTTFQFATAHYRYVI
jgi:hypothetical protein